MVRYNIRFTRSARKELEGLPGNQAKRILDEIEGLENEPRPKGCKKIRGGKNLWRIRVGHHRVIYSISDEESLVDIIYIRHRRSAYK